jgi:hypothetical protein
MKELEDKEFLNTLGKINYLVFLLSMSMSIKSDTRKMNMNTPVL